MGGVRGAARPPVRAAPRLSATEGSAVRFWGAGRARRSRSLASATVTDAFYLQIDEQLFRATEWTTGPWGPDAQHAGPPSALLGRAIERAVSREDAQVARFTAEILRPVPIADLSVAVHVARPGKSVQMLEARLETDGELVMTARAWSIRTAALDLPPPAPDGAAPAPPDDERVVAFEGAPGTNYLSATEWRFVSGSFFELGPATAWVRMRYPLVAGEAPSPLQRVLVAADSGNGISGALDFSRWMYVNPDLSVYLHRPLEGEWVCLEARTVAEPTGIGLAATTLHDERGPIGRSVQSLFIAPR